MQLNNEIDKKFLKRSRMELLGVTSFSVRIQALGHEVLALIDSGASANFICSEFINSFPKNSSAIIRLPKRHDEVRLANGEVMDIQERIKIEIWIGEMVQMVAFNVVNLGADHFVILGQTYLCKWNPRINWFTGKLTFEMPRHYYHVYAHHVQTAPYWEQKDAYCPAADSDSELEQTRAVDFESEREKAKETPQ